MDSEQFQSNQIKEGEIKEIYICGQAETKQDLTYFVFQITSVFAA